MPGRPFWQIESTPAIPPCLTPQEQAHEPHGREEHDQWPQHRTEPSVKHDRQQAHDHNVERDDELEIHRAQLALILDGRPARAQRKFPAPNLSCPKATSRFPPLTWSRAAGSLGSNRGAETMVDRRPEPKQRGVGVAISPAPPAAGCARDERQRDRPCCRQPLSVPARPADRRYSDSRRSAGSWRTRCRAGYDGRGRRDCLSGSTGCSPRRPRPA